jgi:hypothetical protein
MRFCLALFLAGCMAEGEATVDAGSSVASSPAASVPASSATTSSADPAPPSGWYRLDVHIESDDCAPQAAAPATATVVVTMKPSKEGFTANVPLPSFDGGPMARSDLRLERGAATTSSLRGDVSRKLEVTEVARDRFALTRSETRTAPKPCTTRSSHVYTLERSGCEARCGADARALPDGGVELECRCP